MRHIVRCLLLEAFANGSHGPFDDIAAGIQVGRGYSPASLKVQVSQVRRDLMAECKIDIGEVRGRMSNEQLANIERQLQHVPVQKRIVKLTAAAQAIYRQAA